MQKQQIKRQTIDNRLGRNKSWRAYKAVSVERIASDKPFDYWLKKNKYYHKNLLRFYRFVVPAGAAVLLVNCKNGYLLDGVTPSVGVGIDDEPGSLEAARDKYPQYSFFSRLDDVPQQTFDYIVLNSVTMEEYDIQGLFEKLLRFSNEKTRIVIDTYSYLWEPILWLTQKLGLRRPTAFKNWISQQDLHNFLHLSGWSPIISHRHTLLPMYLPIVSTLFNSVFIHIPLINRLCLHEVTIARPVPSLSRASDYKVSVIIPCKNEKGNIEAAVKRCPVMGKETELIFVEGNSQDGTFDEIQRVMQAYRNKNVHCFVQDGKGKGNAVRIGLAQATGDIVMILDADLTVAPEELPLFVGALVRGKGELINGSRLVYGMESGSMRFLNILANFFFSVLFSWLLGQKVKDTLCGTKVLFASDYQKIADNRSYFGNFDPFGDFDLLFGAAKLNLKIIDMPVHYKNRTYGSTQIRRFLHGWILLGMSFIALKKFKFR